METKATGENFKQTYNNPQVDMSEYEVKDYGVVSDYDGPYLNEKPEEYEARKAAAAKARNEATKAAIKRIAAASKKTAAKKTAAKKTAKKK